MGHNICAIIGEKPINEDNVKKYQLAIAYEGNFAIVILERESIYYWGDKLNLSFESESNNIDWACELIFYFAKELGLKKYGIIQTDYFGGIGEQYASLYENGNILLNEKSINEILREIGVNKNSFKDEFDTLNLGEYRGTEQYYWETQNFADRKPNMIAGKIPKDFS
jgi:hypothetical protein